MNTLLIGDIHGCYTELLDLLDQAALSDGDRIIALGDIVDRGPATPQVLDFIRNRTQALSLMGNHERKHLRWERGEVKPALSQHIAKQQLGSAYPDALKFLETFPTYLELPEAILIHGYLEPGVPLEAQPEAVLCGTMGGEYYLAQRYAQPWYELYPGEKPVVFAHHDHLRNGQPFVYQDRLFGLDTSCVHGSRLTGLLLPGFTFFSVPSRANYWMQIQRAERAKYPRPPRKTKPQPVSSPWDDASERALVQLLAYAAEENQRILAWLQDDPEFSALAPRQQAKAYAEAVRGSLVEWLLHLARRGELTPERAKLLLGGPEQALKLADEIDLE
jgi:serine/threonine protein phosphatase 1